MASLQNFACYTILVLKSLSNVTDSLVYPFIPTSRVTGSDRSLSEADKIQNVNRLRRILSHLASTFV